MSLDEARSYVEELILEYETKRDSAAISAARALRWYPKHHESDFQSARRIVEKWSGLVESYRAVLAAMPRLEVELAAEAKRFEAEQKRKQPVRDAEADRLGRLGKVRALTKRGSEAFSNARFFMEQKNPSAAAQYWPLLEEVLACEEHLGINDDNDRTILHFSVFRSEVAKFIAEYAAPTPQTRRKAG